MQPGIDSLLTERRTAIVDRWLETILDTYAKETKKHLIKVRDPIANPVGQTFARELGPLYDAVIAEPELDREAARRHLDPVVRIRAVQDFSPGESLAFVFELKRVVRAVLRDRATGEGLAALDGRVDALALIAFEVYLTCVKKMYEIRVDEMRRRTGKLMERMNRAPRRGARPAGARENCE